MRHALVIGGGLAGPATAMALQRAGLGATVFEAYPPTPPDVGSYLAVSPNGLHALRILDLLHLAQASGIPTRKNVLWNERGRRLAEIPLGSRHALTLKRSRLGRALQDEAMRRGIDVLFGKRLVDAVQTGAGAVVATFDDGSQAEGDLLIGADGVRSRTRQLIDRSAPAGRYVGLTNFGGYTPNAGLDAEAEAWHMYFGRRGFFGFILDGGGGAVWFVNLPRTPISPDERASTSLAVWRQQLVEAFVADAGPAADLIARGELELAADNTFDLPHVPVWHRGHMLVIGDAAHAPSPSSGQGASMALEDAIVLAKCLRDVSSIADAFATYEQLRRDRVERIVAHGARSSSSKVPGPFGRVVRDLMLRLMLRFFVTERALAWITDYRVDWATPVDARRASASTGAEAARAAASVSSARQG